MGHDSLASSDLQKGADLPRGPIPEASAKLSGRNTIFKNGILIACTAEGLLMLVGLISPGNPFPPFQEGRHCLQADRVHLFFLLGVQW